MAIPGSDDLGATVCGDALACESVSPSRRAKLVRYRVSRLLDEMTPCALSILSRASPEAAPTGGLPTGAAMLQQRCLLLLVGAILLSIGRLIAADVFYEAFPAFVGIQTPLPLDGNLLASPGNGTYDVSLSGPSELTAAFAPAISGSTLNLGFRPGSSFNVDGAANYTIRSAPQCRPVTPPEEARR